MNTPQEVRTLILELLKKQGFNSSQMLTSLNYNQSLIYDMERRKQMPAADKLGCIADYLHVSVDYLLGLDDVPNRKAQISQPTGDNMPE